MARAIDYYFSLVSPWSYLGHTHFIEMARRHGAEVNYIPVSLDPVFAETGGLPLPKRAPHRQRYRYLEMQRWREKRDISLNLRPRFWPFNVHLANRVVLALVDGGADPDLYMRGAFAGIWARELDMGDESVIARQLREAGNDPARTIQAAKSERIGAMYENHVQQAIAADVFGAPSYVLDGEVFWGQDRLDLLDDALSSGRKAFRPV